MSKLILKQGNVGSLVAGLQKAIGVDADGDFGPKTDAALKFFQAKQGLRADGIAGPATFAALKLDFGRYIPNGEPNAIAWELPASGLGFRTYNRESYGDQFGTKETIERLIQIGEQWHAIEPNIDLQFGDISRLYGGRFVNPLTGKTEHASHRDGRAVDMRPIRKDGEYQPTVVGWSSYSRELTEKFLRLIYKKSRVYFNDKDLRAKGLCQYAKGHDNHLHIIL